ncbi:MAG: spheroidene monooxygenase [Acidimicrobiales bacterium]
MVEPADAEIRVTDDTSRLVLRGCRGADYVADAAGYQEDAMIALLGITDGGLVRSGRLALGRRIDAPGLLDLRIGQTARLRDSLVPDIAFGRLGIISFWDDDDSLDEFLTNGDRTGRGDRLAESLREGWMTRLRPLRVHGAWPGLPEDTPTARHVEGDGPVVVLTIGNLRVLRSWPWRRASIKAEGDLANAEGLIWAMGMSQPPRFVATMSVWESAEATQAYAYGANGAHHRAIQAKRATPFMHQEAFIRFQPYASTGSLDGNPALADDWLRSRLPAGS